MQLVIENLNSSYTGYPFEEKGKFISKDKGLQQIWETVGEQQNFVL
jgi:hypothetical protein